MKAIGIDQDSYLVYEGQRCHGLPVWPQPTLLAAAVVDESQDPLMPAPNDLQRAPFIFVDEEYDPVSRVRKGRLFEKPSFPVETWHVPAHPAVPGEHKKAAETGGLITKSLVSFWEFNWVSKLKQLGITRPWSCSGTWSNSLSGRLSPWSPVFPAKPSSTCRQGKH